uniref:Uncharacterized protein n=1 Tax=viral metagenome TaxID=1070528 RepID=A0A6M3KPH7_9ZZZZ
MQNSTQQVIDRCKELIEQYGKNCEKMTGDDLILMQDKLAVASCYLGEIEAENNKDYAMSYRNRLMVKASSVSMAIAEGDGVTKAKEESENDPDVQSSRYDEIINSYLAENVQNLLKGITRVLTAIQFRITRLRDEQRNS